MAKSTGIKITIATIATVLGIAWVVWRMGDEIWDQGATHAAEAVVLKTTVKRVDKLEPEVKLNTEGRTQVQTDIEWIKGAVDRIEKKL